MDTTRRGFLGVIAACVGMLFRKSSEASEERSHLVYPMFSRACCEDATIPKDCRRYLSIDPGASTTSILAIAVSPSGEVIPYGEITVPGTVARVAHTVGFISRFADFEYIIIDGHSARQTPMGWDVSLGEMYDRELASVGVSVKVCYSNESVLQRTVRTHYLMLKDRLRISKCPSLVSELETLSYSSGEKPNYRNTSFAVCLEMFAASRV